MKPQEAVSAKHPKLEQKTILFASRNLWKWYIGGGVILSTFATLHVNIGLSLPHLHWRGPNTVGQRGWVSSFGELQLSIQIGPMFLFLEIESL